jgi:cytochrome c biogenesis protein CcmG/thiol:disulfide interchange protein DsbE
MSNRPNPRGSSAARVAAAQKSGSSTTTWWIAGGVAIVIVIALVAAIAITSKSDSSSGTGAGAAGTVVPVPAISVGEVTVTGTPIAQAAPGAADSSIGKPVPQISGQQFDGTKLTIPAAGTPKVVVFVAHWCPHCQKEVPELSKHWAEVGLPSGVDLYAVATSTSESKPNFPPGKWLREENWPVKTIADDTKGSAANAYGVTGFPYFVAVDAQGNVALTMSGEITLAQFQQLVDAAKTGSSGAATGTTGPASPR